MGHSRRPFRVGASKVRATTTGAGILVALVAFLVYNANGREIGSYDSQPAKFTAMALAGRGTFLLNRIVGERPLLAERPAFVKDRRGNWRAATPVFSAVPAAAVAWIASTARVLDLESSRAPEVVAKVAASLTTALAVAFAFAAAGQRVSGRAAVLIAGAFGFGTNLWGCASQTLWQHDLVLFGLTGAIALLAVPGHVEPRRAVGAGVSLAIALAARPYVAPAVGVLALSTMLRTRGPARALSMIPVVLAGLTVAGTNLLWFGNLLGGVSNLEALNPAIHGVTSSFNPEPWIGALGLLGSANRGLLVFSPVVAFALPGFAAAWREGPRNDLFWCACAFVAQFALYACYSTWWGGHTYGPRYMLDTLPMLVPLAAAWFPVLAARRSLQAVAVAALAWSVYVAWLGAFVYPSGSWNLHPRNVDRFHERLWDFADTQIRRSATAPMSPQNFNLCATR